jgi:hypothetical protein
MGTVEEMKALEDTSFIGWYSGHREVDRITAWALKAGRRVLRVQLLENSTNTYLVEISYAD